MRQKFKLNQLGTVGRGKSKHRPRNDPILYNGLYPFFQTGDVKDAELYLREYSQTYSDAGLAQSKLWYPGTLCITIAANVADTAILGLAGCFPDSVVGFVADPSKADTRFIKYYIDTLKKQMVSASKGTTQDNLSLDKLLTFEFLLPTVDEQKKIAEVLTAYDDLIQNNKERISILEGMAQKVYEEWFIDFRYPGHEAINLVDSEIGRVPTNWIVMSASEALQINPKVFVPKKGFKSFVPMGCLSTNTMLISNVESREGNSGAKFQNGDTLFARITPCLENGKTGFVQFLPTSDSVAFGSTEFIVLRSRNLCPEFVYLLARSENFRNNAIKSMGGADGRQRVKEGCFDGYKLAHPTQELLRSFSNLVSPMFKLIQNLNTKNASLRATRDLLLPRLISGELDVSKLPELEEIVV